MPANYPTSAPNLKTDYADNTDDVMAANQNQPNLEINAIAGKVGTGSSTPTSGKLLRGTGTGASAWDKEAPTGDIVGTTDTQTLTNKTLTSPTVNTPTLTLANSTPTEDGSIGFDRTNEYLVVGDGTNSKKIHMGEWIAYTPTFTNLTLGNGTLVARYTIIGNTVIAFISIIFGSTTSVSGEVRISTPTNMDSTIYTGACVGFSQMRDDNTTNKLNGVVFKGSANTIGVYVNNSVTTSGSFTATAPWTWATSDTISLSVQYEAA